MTAPPTMSTMKTTMAMPMADKPLQLKLYQSVIGPVAYDALGRTYVTRKEGDRVVPVGVPNGPWAIVDHFDDGKKKAAS